MLTKGLIRAPLAIVGGSCLSLAVGSWYLFGLPEARIQRLGLEPMRWDVLSQYIVLAIHDPIFFWPWLASIFVAIFIAWRCVLAADKRAIAEELRQIRELKAEVAAEEAAKKAEHEAYWRPRLTG